MNKSKSNIKEGQFNPYISESVPKWFAVKTRYKCEKYVADALVKKRIESYLPLIEKTKRYERKIKNYRVPLIHNYIFVLITKAEYIKILETEYVTGFIRHGRQLIAVPDEEIQILKKIVGEFEQVKMVPTDYTKGDHIEIISGHLTGLQGTISQVKGKKSVIVHLQNMGLSFLIEVNKDFVALT